MQTDNYLACGFILVITMSLLKLVEIKGHFKVNKGQHLNTLQTMVAQKF